MKLRRDARQLEVSHREAIRLAARLTPFEGYNQTLVNDVTVLRRSKSVAGHAVVYEPSLIFVVQGKKVDSLGSLSIAYGPRTMLVLSAPMPFQCVFKASEPAPLLSVVVRLRREIVLSLVTKMKSPELRRTREPAAIRTASVDDELSSALVRLLRTATSPDDAQVLGDQTVRELIYLVLKGEGGDGIRAMVDAGGAFEKILSALQRIHKKPDQPLVVADLARQAGMSVSAFHSHFKRVTSISPIQYIKAVRLQKARALLLRSGVTAGSAAASVGYSSASQFGRDFKRMYGLSPARDIAKLRGEDSDR